MPKSSFEYKIKTSYRLHGDGQGHRSIVEEFGISKSNDLRWQFKFIKQTTTTKGKQASKPIIRASEFTSHEVWLDTKEQAFQEFRQWAAALPALPKNAVGLEVDHIKNGILEADIYPAGVIVDA